MPVERMLFATSGAALDAESLRNAECIASLLGFELHVLRIVSRPSWSDRLRLAIDPGKSPPPIQQFVALCRQTRRLCRDALTTPLDERRWRVEMGQVLEEILVRADELDASWIALGASEPDLGFLACMVAQITQRPVLVPKAPLRDHSVVIAAHARADKRRTVLQRAEWLASLSDNEVVTLRDGSARLSRADEASSVLAQARARDAALVVVGAHQRSRVRRALFGTTAQRIVDRAERAVVVSPIEPS